MKTRSVTIKLYNGNMMFRSMAEVRNYYREVCPTFLNVILIGHSKFRLTYEVN